MSKRYKFRELSKRSQNIAITDYCKGWLITHPDDPLDEFEVGQILYENEKDLYTKEGEYLGE